MSIRVDQLAVIAARGPDSRAFLQGQLSQNSLTLGSATARPAGYHNPQGRVLAVVWLLAQGEQDVALLLPRELAADTAQRLAKFVLRSKTKISDESSQWQVLGHTDGPPANGWALADRWVSLEPRSGADDAQGADDARWRALDIAAGLPQVYAATSEQFIAQMLNLDLIGGIAFDKGCYTGQEIIARTHYRGRVKRRMQRFAASGAAVLLPGARITLQDGRSAQVVDAVRHDDNSQEFLAVTQYGDVAAEADDAAASGERVDASPLPLPYQLPL